MYLRRSESEIMNALWESQSPLSSSALLAATPQRKWQARSIFAILDGLLEKELIYEAGFTRSGKTIARTFAPTLTYPQFVAMEVASSPRRPSLPELLTAFLDAPSTKVTKATLDELEAVIAERRSKLRK